MKNDDTQNVIKILTLNDGNTIPMLGYGVFQIPDSECAKFVLSALDCGYRHIDTAQIYGNESGVGSAVAECGIARDELFITSKIWVKHYGYEKALKSIDDSLERLQTDYIDLMLLHRPYFDYAGAWKALEKAQADGKVRSIGLSNFSIAQTEEILRSASVMPAVNQIELHPYFAQSKLREYLAGKGIAVEAWYPLGHGNKKLLKDKTISALAGKYGKTPSQIILRWHVQSANIVFPKTRSVSHMRENAEIFEFELESEDMAAISALDKGKPLFNVPDWWQKFIIKLGK